MARKQKHEEHENHERWLVSYADFITLLFAFFVVMYSISSVNEGKYRVLSDSLMAAFRSSPKTMLPIQEGQPAKAPQTQNLAQRPEANLVAPPDLPLPDVARRKKNAGGPPMPAAEIATRLEEQFDRLIDEDLIAVRFNDDYVELEIKGDIIFLPGSTQLTREAQDIVRQLGLVLRNFPNVLRVEGFTDDTPVKSVVYPSNWELSGARAGAVVRELVGQGVPPPRLSAVGYGQYRPIADNDTPEGRNRNRRVNVVVLNQTDTEGLREDLHLASLSKTGKPPPGVGDGERSGWAPPVDVTSQPLTEQSRFSVIDVPLNFSNPVAVDVKPPTGERVDSVPREFFTGKEGASR
jgi:chemotaxis protein MotB